jgi:hypothetical protein
MEQFIAEMVAKYPTLAAIVVVVGIMRIIAKPLMTFLHSVVQATPSDWDDKLLAKVEASKWLKWLLWALDYAASIKVIHPDTKKNDNGL